MDEELTREQLVEYLAEVSHKTFLRHALARGDDPASLSEEVHEHDRDRAQDTVQELERLGIWPAQR